MIRHHRVLYRDLSDPVALLSGKADTELSRFWAYVGGAQTLDLDEATAKTYSDLMAASQAMVAEETLAAVPLTKVERMLDVGGGDGAFAEAALRAAPEIEILSPASLGIVCFRFRPEGGTWSEERLEALNRGIQDTIVAEGTAMMSSTRLRGRYALRLCILNYRSTAADVRAVVERVVELGRERAGVVEG
jgi:demethylspheroidene O-methyltransferase